MSSLEVKELSSRASVQTGRVGEWQRLLLVLNNLFSSDSAGDVIF